MNRYEERIAGLRGLFEGAGIDGLYITKPSNVAYFTGTKGDDCSLWITGGDAYIITDFRYREMAQGLSWLSLVETRQGCSVTDFLRSVPEKRIGIERNSLKLNDYLIFTDRLSCKDIVITGEEMEFNGLVETLRIVKDDYEIEQTRLAEQIGCDAFNYILGCVKPGMTENQVARQLEYYMLTHGAEDLSFSTICLTGPNCSKPHGVPGSAVIEEGQFILMDYGCKVNGYCSDMTRTICVGKPTQRMKDCYSAVLEAQMTACDGIKAGIIGRDGHNIAVNVLEKYGLAKYFGHGLGHGTGLDIHENPRLALGYKDPIPAGSICSIEPGIYLSGELGIRIEDLAIITSDGIINLALGASKDLITI